MLILCVNLAGLKDAQTGGKSLFCCVHEGALEEIGI